MKITYNDGSYRVIADKDDLNISFRAENIEAAKRYYLHIIEERFYNAVNMGLLDPDVMNWKGVSLPEQSCLKISDILSKNF
jgi:hypothetical protein